MINDKGEACLSDFSRARIFDTHELTTKVSSKWRYKAPELGISYEEDNVNPPTTEGWRWIACELMTDDSCISRPTTATDVWSFAMTVVEVRIFCNSSTALCVG
jgi:serine/threonine protein kinase